MRRALLSLVVLIALVAFVVTAAEAQTADISVTVTVTAGELSVIVDPASWAAGSLTESGSATTGTGGHFTATNDNTNIAEDFSIQVLSSDNWSPAATAGSETFVMEAQGGDLTSLTSIHASQVLETDLAPSSVGDVGFDLTITVPSSTVYGGVEQTIPVRVTAAAS